MASKIPMHPNSIGRQLNFTTGKLNALCEQRLAPYDLSLPQWVVLSCIWREGPLPVGTLSKLLGTGMPATSRLIDRMEDRGLVQKKRDATDARVTVVDVTETGQSLDHLSQFFLEINETLMQGFTEPERVQVFDLLLRMEANAAAAIT